MNKTLRPLNGLRTVCSGLSVASLTAARMLSEQGARVTLVASETFLQIKSPAVREFYPAFELMSVNAEYPGGSAELKRLRAEADMWIDETGVLESEAAFKAADTAPAATGQVRCTFSAYPFPAPPLSLCELETAVSLRACLYEPITGLGPRRPFPFPAASLTAGMYGAAGIAATLLSAPGSAAGRTLSVSLYDAALSLLSLRLILLSEASARWDALRWLSSPFMALWKTGEGWIYLHAGLTKHMALFLRVLAGNGFEADSRTLQKLLSPASIKDPVSLDSPLQALRISRTLRNLFLKQTAGEWETLLRRHRLCCVKVRTEAEWLEFTDSPEFKKDETSAASVRLTSGPARSGPREGSCPGAGLSGVSLFDFTQVIAGPLAGRTLSEIGASVLRIRNPHFDQAFTEPFAASFHSGKENVTVDLTNAADRARLDEFYRSRKPEVVLQHALPADIPVQNVTVQILAYPERSAWSSMLGFEQNIQAMAGLMAAYGSGERPELFPVAIYDTTTGLLAAYGACLGLYAHRAGESAVQAKCSLMDSARLLSGCTRLQRAYRGPKKFSQRAGFGFLGIKRLLKRELQRPGSPIKALTVPGLGIAYVPTSPIRFNGREGSLAGTHLPDTEIPRKRPSFVSRMMWLLYFLFARRLFS